MKIDRRRLISHWSAAVAASLPLAWIVRVQDSTRVEAIDVRDYGAVGDGVSDDSRAVQTAIHAARGRWVYFPQGTYRISSIEAATARIFGDGATVTKLELASTLIDSLFTIGEFELRDLSVSDRGRADLDRTENPNVQLFQSETSFKAVNCVFLTNRSVLSQTSSSEASSVVIQDCSVARLAAAKPGEQDRMNLFTCRANFLHFNNLRATNLAARSVINAMYSTDQLNGDGSPSAFVENCTFDYIYNTDTSEEVKVLFLQGYESTVRKNRFLDCFGRHIDFLGNPNGAGRQASFFMNLAVENEIRFSKRRQDSVGAKNDEAGSIYCRYANVGILDNFQDFTNLQLSSAGYNAISVRHGYEKALIQDNVVVNAKGHAIEADISDAVDTGECSVVIVGNRVSSVRSTRHPISISNYSKNKFFRSVVLKNNIVEYTHDSAGIFFERGAKRQSIFTVREAKLIGNSNISFSSENVALFLGLPLQLYAPDTDVRIKLEDYGSAPLESAEVRRQATSIFDGYSYKSLSFRR